MQVKIKILRFNPELDTKAHYETYTVEQEPTDRVLDALNNIKWYTDGTLTFRRSCAHGVCGSDAMRINGRNRLACKLLIQDVGANITVEPIMGFRVLKDLVVDMEPFFASYRAIKPFLITSEQAPAGRERYQAPEDRQRI
ncbi:MAG: 2Fe-2S iron-sulfur cluster-binding protein, partial [Chloroflexota bacterium]|nr:2Fe-2S iron-sulfur cluster-binding protein [Chloroflexota bacterium]